MNDPVSPTPKPTCDLCGRPVYRHHWFSVLRGYCLTRLLNLPCEWMRQDSERAPERSAKPAIGTRHSVPTPDARILICLGPCHGEFYLPLGPDDQIVCPNDRTHPVALYQNPGIHAGDSACQGKEKTR